MQIRCIGCGATLQTNDNNKPGYVPQNVLDNNDISNILCYRCHQIKNHGLMSVNPMPKRAYYEILNKVTKSNSLFIYVIDLFNLNASIDPDLVEMLKNKDSIAVLTKRDIMPKSAKDGSLRKYVIDYFKEVNYKPKDIIFVSSKNKYHIDDLIKMIEKYRKNRNCYTLGNTNVGKSSLINSIIKATQIYDKDLITISPIPATTLNLIEVPLFENAKLYDTPGLVREDNILSKASAKDYSTILPKVEIKPMGYQLDSKQSLIIGGFAKVDYLEGEKNKVIAYFANSIEITRNKLEKALEIFPDRLLELYKINGIFLKEDYKNIIFEFDKPTDIYIHGLGFVTFKLAGKVNVTVPSGVKVEARNAIFG